jgi:hypothetical protein
MDVYALGRYLRETREARELTLEQAESQLKIRRHVLEGFEQGDFQPGDLSPVQLRGMIRNYATFLGLEADRVLLLYDSALNGTGRRKRGTSAESRGAGDQRIPADRPPSASSAPPVARPATESRRAGRGRRTGRKSRAHRRLIAEQEAALTAALNTPRSITDTNPSLPRVSLGERRELDTRRIARILNTLIIIVIALAAIGVILFVVAQLIQQSQSSVIASDDNPILADFPLTPTFTLAPTFTPRPTDPQIASAPVQNYTGSGVAVTIEAAQRTWLRVLTDGNTQIARLVLPGEVLEYRAQDLILVNASNARALNVIYNGEQQGSFGLRGQAVEIRFGETEMDIMTVAGFGPTPLASPTATSTADSLAATLIFLQTPSPTEGPSPTPTQTPTATTTPPASATPTISPTPSITFTPSPSPTATVTPGPSPTPSVTPPPLPPRVPAASPTPTKSG